MLNKAILIGTLGRDPELTFMPDGGAVCKFSIATSEKWKKDGEQQEATEWHNVVAFRKLAEISAQYLSKGKKCYVEGKIKTRKWEKDGVKRYSTEIIADEIKFLSPSDSGANREPQAQAPAERIAPPIQNSMPTQTLEDDIPF